ncbi:MAG: transporter substrate-binding domain-containing protein [Pseudomonadota bacterium]
MSDALRAELAPTEWLRAGEIAFTPAYAEIEATYLVPAGSPIRSIAEVDRPGVRIAVSERSAYDMYLRRTLAAATLVHAPGIEASYQAFVAQKLDALAGLKPRLLADRAKLPGSRILEGRFTAIQHRRSARRSRASRPARGCARSSRRPRALWSRASSKSTRSRGSRSPRRPAWPERRAPRRRRLLSGAGSWKGTAAPVRSAACRRTRPWARPRRSCRRP